MTTTATMMKKATKESYLIALDIAEKLVLEKIPFRTTHKIAGQLVQIAHQSKKPISKLTPFEIKQSVKDTNADSKLVSEIIKTTTISSSLRDRISKGSSGYLEQKQMISQRLKKINEYRIKITKRDNQVTNSLENLSNKIQELIK